MHQVRRTGLLGLLVGVAVAPVAAIGQPATSYELFVDPVHGNDQASGRSAAAALRSVQEAQERVRKSDRTRDVIVNLRGGYYFLKQPLTFGVRDGGEGQGKVVYRAYSSTERPVISGGILVARSWSDPDGDGIYEVAVPRDVRSRNLYINGTEAKLASGGHPFNSVTITDEGFVANDTPIPDYRNPSLVEFVWPGSWKWRVLSMEQARRVSGKTVVTMKQPGWSLRSGGRDSIENPGSPMHERLVSTPVLVRNAFELIDEPGEWYLDHVRSRLFYKPAQGVDLNSAEVVLATIPDSIVKIAGSVGRPVRNLSFEGINFAHATNLRPQTNFGHIGNQSNTLRDKAGTWEVSPGPATVRVSYAEAIGFHNIRLINSGTAGIFFDRGTRKSEIVGSVFSGLGGNGIQIGDLRRSIDDIRSCVGCDGYKDVDRVTQIDIRSNYLFNIGSDAPNAAQGIHIAWADNVRVAHNEIRDIGYTPIALGYRWSDQRGPYGSNVVTANRVYDVVKSGRDGGGIYNVGNQAGTGSPTYISGNHIFRMHHDFGALYPDEGSSDIIWERNLIENMGERTWLHNNSYAQHMSQSNLVIQGNFSDTALANNGGKVLGNEVTIFLPGARPKEAEEVAAAAGVQTEFRSLLEFRPLYQAENAPGVAVVASDFPGFNGSGFARLAGGKPQEFRVNAGLGGPAKLVLRYRSGTGARLRVTSIGTVDVKLPASLNADWLTFEVPIETRRGEQLLVIEASSGFDLDEIALTGTVEPNGPADLVPVAGALTRLSTIQADGGWRNIDRVVDGSSTSGEAVADRSENALTFDLGGKYRRFVATLTEDNEGEEQITSWRLQLFKDGEWVSVSPWLASDTKSPQTYALHRHHTAERLRVLLRNETPGGKVGLVEFRAVGSDVSLPEME